MSKNKKYYWLKLKEDFFERDEIKIIESQKNGKDYREPLIINYQEHFSNLSRNFS